jgi:hypothetical protein
MGWAPGKGLGNELQGEKSNIKYSLKDDLLGVGAKREIGGGVWRGMGEVDDLYRRLDVGGSPKPKAVDVAVDEVQEEVSVRGGWKMNFQVGDTYKSSFSREESEVEGQSSTRDSGVEGAKKEKSKKRKRESDKEEKEPKKSKKEKVDDSNTAKKRKSAKGTVEKPKSEKETVHDEKPAAKKSKKDKTSSEKVKVEKKKSKRSKSSRAIPAETAIKELDRTAKDLTIDSEVVPPEISLKDKIAKDKKQKDKKQKKEKKEKRDKKEEKEERAEKTSTSKEKGKEKDKSSERKDKKSKRKSEDSSIINGTTQKSLPHAPVSVNEPVISTPVDNEPAMPRHMHRSRFLAMKRASVMDNNALREILGVKG